MAALSPYERRQLIDDISDITVMKLMRAIRQEQKQKPRLVTLKEAAAILHRSASWLYHNKDKFSYNRDSVGRLLFREDELVNHIWCEVY